MTSAPACDVSVLIPVHDERENLRPLYEQLDAALGGLTDLSWEVVFIDDGSSDGSGAVLTELAAAAPERVRVLVLRRNYGQTAALDAGFQHARGRILVPLDADLQNDPADIPALLGEIARGADLVSGWRRRRHDTFVTRRLPSWFANALIARVTGVQIHDFGCTLKAYRREVLEGVRLYGEMHRFIPVYAAWNGAKVVEREVHHRPRLWGRSKYGLQRTLKVVLDLLTVLFLQRGYAARPIHVFGTLGVGLVGLAVTLAVYALYQKSLFPVDDPRHIFVHRNPLATLATLVMILGVGGVALGLVAELLARIYHVTAAGAPYTLAGGRNVPELPTPEAERALSPALEALGRDTQGDP